MAVLGNIIKASLEIAEKLLPEKPPIEAQLGVLQHLLEKARKTSFGKHYDFDAILKESDIKSAFASAVPYHDYDTMNHRWWRQQRLEALSDQTWPGRTDFYALSAGTTGKNSKRIPVTEEMLEAIRKTSILQILSAPNFNLPADFFEKEIMMLGSSAKLKKQKHWKEGEISGISASNIPQWFERFYRPGKKIAAITDWDKRVAAIAKNAKSWDIGAIAGIPSWNELMLKHVIEYHKAQNIHEIWPNLNAFVSGGVAFEPYRKSFEKLIERPITIMDTYLASEGFLAYQARPNKNMAMKLSTNSGIYFEFVPFTENNVDELGSVKQNTKALGLSDVREDTDYVIIISTVSGAWRYLIGDTIRFTDKKNAEIIITGRTKHFLNVVGSQLSVIQMNKVMKAMEQKFGISIPEFTVSAVREENDYIHHWYIGSDQHTDAAQLAQALDHHLKQMNKAYKMARTKALKDVRVSITTPETFHAWIEKHKSKGGQVKVPRVMKESDFRNWQAFAQKNNCRPTV